MWFRMDAEKRHTKIDKEIFIIKLQKIKQHLIHNTSIATGYIFGFLNLSQIISK